MGWLSEKQSPDHVMVRHQEPSELSGCVESTAKGAVVEVNCCNVRKSHHTLANCRTPDRCSGSSDTASHERHVDLLQTSISIPDQCFATRTALKPGHTFHKSYNSFQKYCHNCSLRYQGFWRWSSPKSVWHVCYPQ
jgi:hypothetical protein